MILFVISPVGSGDPGFQPLVSRFTCLCHGDVEQVEEHLKY
jgi:hypothetical protein